MIEIKGSKFLILDETRKQLALSRSAFYRLRRDDPSFPKPQKIAGKAHFAESALADWLAAQVLAKTNADFRAHAPRHIRDKRRATAC